MLLMTGSNKTVTVILVLSFDIPIILQDIRIDIVSTMLDLTTLDFSNVFTSIGLNMASS